MSKLTTLLAKLEQGKITIEEAVAQVSAMDLKPGPPPSSPGELLDKPDPSVPQPGSFFEVSAAYSAGKITSQQYAALVKAAADAAKRGASGAGSPEAGGSGANPAPGVHPQAGGGGKGKPAA